MSSPATSVKVASILVILCALSATAACSGGDGEFSSSPERSAEGHERRWFNNPRELAADAAVVVKGRVLDAGPGRTIHPGAGDEYTKRAVTFEVLETFKSPKPLPSEITIEEEGYDQDKLGYVVNNVQWSQPGDVGYYFLSRLSNGSYGLNSSYGRVLTSAEQTGPSGEDPDEQGPWQGIADEVSQDVVAHEVVGKAIGR